MLKNAPALAIVAVHTAENEPLIVLGGDSIHGFISVLNEVWAAQKRNTPEYEALDARRAAPEIPLRRYKSSSRFMGASR